MPQRPKARPLSFSQLSQSEYCGCQVRKHQGQFCPHSGPSPVSRQGPDWVGNARWLGRDCLPRHAATTQKTVSSSHFRSAFDSSRGDLETFSGQSFPARPGQGDGAGPCRRRAGRAIPQRRIARRLVVRSGPAKGRGNRGKIVTRRAEICGPHRTMPPRRSAGSGRDGGRRTWGAGTGGAESSGSGPVQPAHE